MTASDIPLKNIENLSERARPPLCVELDQSIPVLAEHRVIPHRVFDRQADEPAEQKVIRDLLDQLPFAANAV